MAVHPVDLPAAPPQISWLVEELIPAGCPSMLFGPQGHGKTQIAAFLAVQVVRPPAALATFAGRPVCSGWVAILDADDPDSLGYRIWLTKFLNSYPDACRDALLLYTVSGGLRRQDLADLEKRWAEDPPALVILDVFSSAFLEVDVLRSHQVHAQVRMLADFAKATGAAVLLLDHVGKLAPGQTVADKGPLGTSAKMFAPRAVFALDRLPPGDCEGKIVHRLTCVKESYAVPPPPIGLELVFPTPDSADLRLYPLPSVITLEAKAELAILDVLRNTPAGVLRQDLLKRAAVLANVSTATARRALDGLLKRQTVRATPTDGRGSPALITLALPPVVPPEFAASGDGPDSLEA